MPKKVTTIEPALSHKEKTKTAIPPLNKQEVDALPYGWMAVALGASKTLGAKQPAAPGGPPSWTSSRFHQTIGRMVNEEYKAGKQGRLPPPLPTPAPPRRIR